MSDFRADFSARPNERPGDDAAREARHEVLATLLGAYADGELPPETVSQIDAHLIGCARCRREVAMHAAIHARLALQAPAPASGALRERIMHAVATTPLPMVTTRVPLWRRRAAQWLGAVALCGAAGGLAAWKPWTAGRAATPTAVVPLTSVPLLYSVLADYKRVTAGDLPGRARDLDAVRAAVPFPVEPLPSPELRLLAAWSANLNSEPAAVLAYRWHDQLVLQYLVAEQAFFRHPALRVPAAAGRPVVARLDRSAMVAWPDAAAGVVLVGDVDADALVALRAGVTRR